MQYVAVTYLPDDESNADFDYADVDTGNGNAIIVPASQALRTINRLSRDEGWEVFQIDIMELSQGTGVVMLRRTGNVPSTY